MPFKGEMRAGGMGQIFLQKNFLFTIEKYSPKTFEIKKIIVTLWRF